MPGKDYRQDPVRDPYYILGASDFLQCQCRRRSSNYAGGDRYEILQLLGQGGMGAVYRAGGQELDRLVAIKVIRPELARNAQVLQRFKQELILARQVTHRNIIRIFDLGPA